MVWAWRKGGCIVSMQKLWGALPRVWPAWPLSDEEQASEGRRGRWGTRAGSGWGGRQENRTAGGVTRATSKTHRAQTRWARWESPQLRDPQTHGLLCHYQPPASKSEHIITHTPAPEKEHFTQSRTHIATITEVHKYTFPYRRLNTS